MEWGELDYLIIDCPPGTGDEPLSVCQFIGKCDGAVVVTTAQKVAAIDVRKSVDFCKQLQLPVLGVIQKHERLRLPQVRRKCAHSARRFRPPSLRTWQCHFSVPYPVDPQIAEACDNGLPFVDRVFSITNSGIDAGNIIRPIAALDAEGSRYPNTPNSITVRSGKDNHIRKNTPLAEGKLAGCISATVNDSLLWMWIRPNKELLKREDVEAPPHEPGLLPPSACGAPCEQVIIAGEVWGNVQRVVRRTRRGVGRCTKIAGGAKLVAGIWQERYKWRENVCGR